MYLIRVKIHAIIDMMCKEQHFRSKLNLSHLTQKHIHVKIFYHNGIPHKGAKNSILNLLLWEGDYATKIKLIEKYRIIEDELKDLVIMEKLGILKEPRYINNISKLIEYYKNENGIRKCIELILEKCNLFRSIDPTIEPLLWNSDKTFLASFFYQKKIKEKITIFRKSNKLTVSIKLLNYKF